MSLSHHPIPRRRCDREVLHKDGGQCRGADPHRCWLVLLLPVRGHVLVEYSIRGLVSRDYLFHCAERIALGGKKFEVVRTLDEIRPPAVTRRPSGADSVRPGEYAPEPAIARKPLPCECASGLCHHAAVHARSIRVASTASTPDVKRVGTREVPGAIVRAARPASPSSNRTTRSPRRGAR